MEPERPPPLAVGPALCSFATNPRQEPDEKSSATDLSGRILRQFADRPINLVRTPIEGPALVPERSA